MLVTTVHPLFETPLPDGWKLETVDDIKSPEKSSCVAGPFGSNISSKYFVESGVPIIRGSNLRDDLTRFVPEGFAFVSEEQATNYKAQHVRGGDLVFTCWGTVGQVGIIPVNGPFQEYIISNKQLKLRPNLEISDPVYLFFYFAGPKMVQHILGKAIGAAVPGINLGILKGLPVVLPPLPLQRRIAGILSAYDELIENSQRRIRILEAMALAIYREWFVHFRFPGHEKLPRVTSHVGHIPQGWEVKPLSALCSRMESGGTPKRKSPEYWTDGSIDWFKTGELWDGFLFGSEEKITERGQRESNARIFEPGTILMAIYGSPTVGRMGIVTRPSSCNQAALGLVADTKQISQMFLYFVLLSLRAHFNGLAQGAAQQNISKEKVATAVALAPPRSLVAAFDRLAEPTFDQIQTLQRQVQNLRRTRDLLLPRLLSGQINVN